MLNPGEEVRVPVLLRNFGGLPAEGVTGRLYITTPGVTITQPQVTFADIPAEDSCWSHDGFGIRLDPGLPDEYIIACSLVCTDNSDGTWVSWFELHACAPIMFYVACSLDDAGSTWPNGRLDPGETAELIVTIGNTGLGNSFEVRGILISGDSLLTIPDTHAFFGTVLAGDTVTCTDDRFGISARPGMTPGITIPCELRILGDHGYDTTVFFSFLTGQMVPTDPIPDGPRTPPVYYAYDDSDVFYTEAPTFDWIEIREQGTHLNLGDQETRHIGLPAEFGPFVFYGEEWDSLSVCSNGWFAPGVCGDRAWQNRELPTTRHRALIAVMWDDLDPSRGGDVLTWHDVANHRFVIEWDSVCYSWQPSEWDAFQVIIYDTTRAGPDGNSVFQYQYRTANNYVSCTVGEQDASGTIGINCLFDDVYHRGSTELAPGRAIKFTTVPPELSGIAEPPRPTVLRGRRMVVAPNPFPRTARIHWNLAQAGHADLRVYDASGRAVRTLLSANMAAGEHLAMWDGRDDTGRELAHGIYFVRLETTDRTTQVKAVLAR